MYIMDAKLTLEEFRLLSQEEQLLYFEQAKQKLDIVPPFLPIRKKIQADIALMRQVMKFH